MRVEWRVFRAQARPVPEPLATPRVLGAANAGALAAVALLGVCGLLTDPETVLAVLCALAVGLGVCARLVAAPGIAVVCWIFLNWAAINPRWQLSWAGYPEAGRIGFLLAAAVLGTVIARISHARRAYRRTTAGGG
ncbi:hypothetical protein AAHZ94_25415 [Streptomyces sp. HSW2009]|uniref:hypothetical protein n=1 Tax=Streptomyces sp. HSW2009 TaxID=3142890 RepID=UPI0032ED60CE